MPGRFGLPGPFFEGYFCSRCRKYTEHEPVGGPDEKHDYRQCSACGGIDGYILPKKNVIMEKKPKKGKAW